jgi:hypothetical protein
MGGENVDKTEYKNEIWTANRKKLNEFRVRK